MSIFSKIGDIFKKKDKEPETTETPQAAGNTGTKDSPNSEKPWRQKNSAAVAFQPAKGNGKKKIEVYKPNETPLSERAKENGRRKGEDWTNASPEQLRYNDLYWSTLDDPEHTSMYRSLERYHGEYGGDQELKTQFRDEYKQGQDYLDEELKKLEGQYGTNSLEARALRQFKDDYEKAGRGIESSYARGDADAYDKIINDNIDAIYGGLMSTPEFKKKVEEGKGKVGFLGLADPQFENEKARDLVYYLYGVGKGEDGFWEVANSGLGELLYAAEASRKYANALDTDSDFLRGAKLYGAQALKGIGGYAPAVVNWARGLTGKDQADPNDKDLGGGYTIPDSTDDFLRSTFGKQVKDAGITGKQFDTLAGAGLDEIRGKAGKSGWAKDIMDNATDYQRQVLGFIYTASGKDAAKDAWQSFKDREQAVWDMMKGSSKHLTSGYGDPLAALGQEYYEIDPTEFDLAGKTRGLESTLYTAAGTAAEQIVPAVFALAGGGLAKAAGATAKGVAAVGRLSSNVPFAALIGGRSYDEAKQKGASRGKAIGYSLTEAGIEFAVGQLLDGVNVVGGKLTGGLRDQAIRKITSPVLRALTDAGIRSWGEGTEEYIQEALEPIIGAVWLDEGNLTDAAKETFDPKNILDPDRIYAGMLGSLTAAAMSPGTVAMDISNNNYYNKLGKALGQVDALGKTADIIANSDLSGPDVDAEALEEAKKTAELIKNGKKVSPQAVGKMVVDFGKSGGDLSHLENLDTQGYTKESIALDDMVAGATSMLSTLDGDVALATDIAKLAMGETITEEAQDAIAKSAEAQQVLSELQGDLDMTKDNALTRAARATIITGPLNKIYTTLKNSNPDKNVMSPAVQTLYDSGVKINEAEKIGAVFNKVLDGQKISEKEAKLVRASSPAIRGAALQILGLDLSEFAGADMVLTQLNELAGQQQTVKGQQAAVKRGAKAAAKARMAQVMGGMRNGQSRLQQNDQGGAAGLGQGAPAEGIPGGEGPQDSGFEGTGRPTPYLRRAGQRSRLDSARAGGPGSSTEGTRVSRFVPVKEYSEEERALQERGVRRGADNVLIVEGMDATTGYNPDLGGYFILVPRDGQFTAEQYTDHEPIHLWITHALAPEHRKTVLDAWANKLRAAMGEADFQTLYDFIHEVYEGKGYFDGLTDDAIMYQIYEDMLAFCYAGQAYGTDVNGVDPSQQQALARQFVDDYNLEAIGTGQMSDPAVVSAIQNNLVSEEYYNRRGYLQKDSTEIDLGAETETRAEEPRAETTSERAAANDEDVKDLKRSVKNLRKERKRLIREAEKNGTRDSAAHRDVINALNEQIEEYQSRIDDRTQHSADYEEESYGRTENDQGESRGAEDTAHGPQSWKEKAARVSRKTDKQRSDSRELHASHKASITALGGKIVPFREVPKEYQELRGFFKSFAPDSDVTYYSDPFDDNYMFFAGFSKSGADGGFFINLAAFEEVPPEENDYTLDTLKLHEAAHYWLEKAGGISEDAWVDLVKKFVKNREDALALGKLFINYKEFLQAAEDVNTEEDQEPRKVTDKETHAEIICDIFGGREILFKNSPEYFARARNAVRNFMALNTEQGLFNDADFVNHSADYDPEYYQSIGLISPDGATAAFTDNIGGVHEEILNQLNGTEGEDIKDFIARGGVRVKPNVGLEVNGRIEPTFEQYDVIDAIVENFAGKTFSIDFNIKGTSAGTHTFEGIDIDPSRIYTYLRNYYQRMKASVLDRYTEILGMPVKTMKDAYNLAKFQLQMGENDPELQEIVDTYENRRYSADYDVAKFAEDFDTNEYLNETTELELDGFEIEGADPDIYDYVMAGGPTDLAGAPITNDVRNFFSRAQSYDRKSEVVNGIIPLYLATDNLGFSAYDPSGKSDDGRSIFLTDNRAVGATYGKKGDNLIDMKALGALREHIASELGYEDFDDLPLPTTLAEDRSEDSIRLLYKMYNAVLSYKGKTPWIKNKGNLLPVQVRSKLSNLRESFPQINDLADEVNFIELRLRKADPDRVITEALLNTVATVKEKIQSLLKADEAGNADIGELLNLILKCRNVIDNTAAKLGTSDEISELTRMGINAALLMADDMVTSAATSLADARANGVFFPVTDTAGNRVEVSEVLNVLADSGSWAVYANTTNPLIIWGEGSWWSDLADAIYGEEWEEDFWEWYDNYEYKDFNPISPRINTRAIANYAYERGYDSAIMIDIYDKGGYQSNLPGKGKQLSTVYVVFSPNQIKSVNNKHPSQDRRMNYSADYLNPESEDYLGPEIDSETVRRAQEADRFSTQDVWLENREADDEDAISEAQSVLDDEALESQVDQLLAELEAFPEREAEIYEKIQELQPKLFSKTKAVDEDTEVKQTRKTKKSKATETAPKKAKTPAQMAFQPKKAEAPAEEAKPEPKAEEKKPLKVKPIPKAKPVDNGVTPDERSEYEKLKAELKANPELANDPAFLARAVSLMQEMGQETKAMTEKAEKLEAAVEAKNLKAAEETTPAEETAAEPEKAKTVTTVEDTETQYARKDKGGNWWKNIGRSDTIEIRRRRSDRNAFDVRITDAKGNTVVYDDVSPAMLTKAFGVKTNDRLQAIDRMQKATALAQNVSLSWSKFDNPDVEKAPAKPKPNRSKDNLGRDVPARLSQYMEKSAIRTADGALINTYRLAQQNGVHNSKAPGRFAMFTERPASMNIQRGMTGAEAYGQNGKSAGEKLAAIFNKLADPKTSADEVKKLRDQIAKLEEQNKKYFSGITRLDPFRPGFQFAQSENIVNGKSLLETYLDIRKPKVIDAKGQGMDFVQREVRNFINDPANKAGIFDTNRDPVGPNDGFKFTNVNVVPEGQTLGGGERDLDTVYVTFRNNQAKSTYNTNPTTGDLLQYSADYDALVEEDAMKKGVLEKKPNGYKDAKGYSISPDQEWYFDQAKMLDKDGRLVNGILPLYGGSKGMHLMWDPKKARKTKALYLATNPRVSEGYTSVPESQGKVADLMAYEQLVEKLANAVRMSADTLVEKIPALRKFAEGTDKYADEGARRLVVMYNNSITKDNPMRGRAELVPTDGTNPPQVKFADGSTVAASKIPNFLPAANIRMFYANTKNPFVIYGNHANWRHIYMGSNKAFMDWKSRVWNQPGYEEFEMKPDSTYVDTDTIVQYVLEETPNDSVIFHDIMDAIGKHPDGYGDVYVVFDPTQAKSVNNRHPSDDVRYNHSADYDAKVFKDMEDRGIIEKGRRGHHDIDGNYISPTQASYFDMAKSLDRNGQLVYGVIPLFHGGRSIYLVWDRSKASGAKAIFLATNPATSESYMASSKPHLSPGEMVDLVKHEAMVNELTDRLGIGQADMAINKLIRDIKYGSAKAKNEAAKAYAEIYNATVGQEYGKITPVELSSEKQIEQALKILEDDQHKLGNLLADLEDIIDRMSDSDTREQLINFDQTANDLYFAVDKLRKMENLDWSSSYQAANLARQVAMDEPIIDPETGEILNHWVQEQAKRIREQINTLDDAVMTGESVLFENEGMDGYWSELDDLPPILVSTGVSAFYANTTNPLVVDGTESDWLTGEAVPGHWDDIDVSRNPELLKAFPGGRAATDDIAEYAHAAGYDSVIIHNIFDNAAPDGMTNDGEGFGDVYIVFNSNQIKSVNNRFPTEDPRYNHSADYADIDTGYTDGSLEDIILKALWDKDEDHAAAVLTELFYQFVQTGQLPQIENEKTRNIFQPRVEPAEAKVIDDQFKKFIEEYGALEKGVNPARDVPFPRQTDTGYARRFFRSAAEAKNTPEWTMDALKREFLLDNGTYQRVSDKSALAAADRELQRKGFDKVLAEWQAKIDAEVLPSKNDVAVGETLLREALAAGDMEISMRLLSELAEVGTTAGQAVQALSMLKKMPKAYQLYYFQRVANRLNRQYSKRINSGKMPEIKIESKYAKAVLNAKTKEDLDKAINELITHIANQIPSTFADKWNAWRYLSMLGNPKTHFRNILGNALFVPAKFAKDLVAAGLESVIIKDQAQRTTSFKGLLDRNASAQYRALAEKDFEGIRQELQSGGKYNPSNAVLDHRTIFDLEFLEKLRKINGDLLEKEDGAFLKFHYINALTNFLTTKGVSIEELQGTREGAAIMNAARQYAFLEAQKATYRDASMVAAALNSLKRVPVLGVLAEGVLPFTKTPINILKRGVEYSPIGLLNSVTLQLAKLKSGDITANEFVDKLASGLTGTGIAILGLWLAASGLLKGGDDDDDKQADFDKLVGYQNYSINLGNTNYTIDWMAPGALPLFVGAAIYNEMKEKNGLTGADLYNALTVIAEPLTQLSMLSGLNDTFKSAKWDDNPLASVIQSMGAGYFSQGIPTLLGQIARSATPDRRTTYVDKNSDVPQPIQRWVQTNVMGKIPGLNNKRADYIDAWGRKDTTKNFAVRLFDNMFSPGYRNKINATPVDKELQRLAKEVGTGVLMSPADRYIEFNNETHNLTAEQYETYAKVRGNQTFSMLNDLFNSHSYAGLSDDEKAKAVSAIKEYGNVLGKQAVFPEYDPNTDNWAVKCDGDPTRLINMALLKGKAGEKGITVGNNGNFFKLVIKSDWLTPTDQAYAMAQQYTTSSKTVYISRGGPTYELTPERKQDLYKHVRDIYPAYYTKLVKTSKWKNASTSKRLDMLKKMREDISADAKTWLAKRLYKSGAKQYKGK